LVDLRLFNVDTGVQTRAPTLTFGADIRPDQFTLARVDPDEQSFLTLRRSIQELRAADRPVESLQANFWRKIASPMSSILMPLLGAIAAFGLARSGQLLA